MNFAVFYGERSIDENLIKDIKDSFGGKILIAEGETSLKNAVLNEVEVFISNTCDIGIEAALKIVVSFGWKAFRLGTFDIYGDGIKGKFFVIYRGAASKIFDDEIFSRQFSFAEILKYIAEKIDEIKFDRLRSELKRIFAKIGIYSNLLGYEYLIAAVIEVVKDKKLINSLTTELYPKLAKIFSTAEKNIERNMRNAIEVSFNRGKFFETANSIGGNFTRYEKPSNGEFIAFLADMIAE